jgi:hypothetical protein
MWLLGLIVIAVPLFAVGLAVSLVWYCVSPKLSRPSPKKLLAIPLGFVIIPLGSLGVWALFAQALQKSDYALYEEVFGTGTTVPEQSIIFDEFGRGREREIYMRIYPDDAEREFLLGLPGIEPSEATLDDFVSRGDQHGFTWWISSTPEWPRPLCESVRLLEADGFHGWKELRIAECVSRQSELTDAVQRGPIFVIAWHRE